MTDEQIKSIKSIIGKQYARPIQQHLNEIGITNSVGSEISLQTVRDIVTGRTPHPEAELAIIKFVQAAKRKKARIAETKL